MTFLRHILLALAISYGLSVFFWLALNVFILTGFIVVSAGCALAGALLGYLAGKRLWVTAIATGAIRLAAFLAVTNGLIPA